MKPEDRMRQLGARDDITPSEAEWLEFRARGHKTVRNRRIAGALGGTALILTLAAGAYVLTSSTLEEDPRPGPAGPSGTQSPPPDDSQTDQPTPTPVSFNPALQQWFIENGKLQVFYEPLPKTNAPARDAMDALLDGVPSILAETGVSTMIPEGTTLQDITISNGTAEITLAGDFPDDSDTQQDLAQAQIVYTLTQFKTVRDVALSWEQPGGAGVGAAPEGRDRYHDYLPQIVVESPYSDQTVDWTFDLYGIANVFEATVSWQVVDLDGKVLKEGFTTATCGSGCWGTFEDRISIEPFPGRRAILQVFESSAEDGSPLHMVDFPLNFRP